MTLLSEMWLTGAPSAVSLLWRSPFFSAEDDLGFCNVLLEWGICAQATCWLYDCGMPPKPSVLYALWGDGISDTSGCVWMCVCVCVCVCERAHAQLCLTICKPMDCSPSCSSVHGIFQTRIVEWVTISSSRGSPNPGIKPASSVSPESHGATREALSDTHLQRVTKRHNWATEQLTRQFWGLKKVICIKQWQQNPDHIMSVNYYFYSLKWLT